MGLVGPILRQTHDYPLTPGQTPLGFDLVSWMQGSLASGGLTSEEDELRLWFVFTLIGTGAGLDQRPLSGRRVPGGVLCWDGQSQTYTWSTCWMEFVTS